MSRFVAEQTIARSAQDVWAYAADIVRHAEWMTITDARITQGDGTQIGDRGRERMRFGPFGWDVEFEVAEATPGRRIVWKAVDGAPFDLAVSLDLEPVGPASTKATYGADIRLHGLWRLIAPMVALEGRAGPARELQRLKIQVEAARSWRRRCHDGVEPVPDQRQGGGGRPRPGSPLVPGTAWTRAGT